MTSRQALRQAVQDLYAKSRSWNHKVSKMSDAQVLAIYRDHYNDDGTRKKKEKKEEPPQQDNLF